MSDSSQGTIIYCMTHDVGIKKIGERSGSSFNSLTVRIEKATWSDTKDFLLTHESDIATDFEDFGSLLGLFRSIVGRYPK